VLVEFALVALVFVVLAGALFDYGRAFFAAQQAQRAARVAAREVALLPLPPSGLPLSEALACRRAEALTGTPPCGQLAGAPALPREIVFDPDWLAIPCAVLEARGLSCRSERDLDVFFSQLPVVNQLLRPLMFFDRTDACPGPPQPPCLLRYPGALVATGDPASPTGLSVVIPVATETGSFRCVDVLEPVGGAFQAAEGGLVSLRVNYPFQAAALLSWREDGAGGALPVDAEEPGACVGLAPGSATVTTPGPRPTSGAASGTGPYAGALGLGRHLALGREVRPFRRVVSAEAAFRREVYL